MMDLCGIKLQKSDQIEFLMMIIRQICEDNNLLKEVVLEDFKDLLMRNSEEKDA